MPGPWDQDVNSTFTDPAVRAQVDAFMTEKYAPYVTRLEQERTDASTRAALYDALESDPNDTFLALTEQLYGTEARDAILSAFEGMTAQEQQEVVENVYQEAAQQGFDPDDYEIELAPEILEAVEFANSYREVIEEQAANEEYEELVGDLQAERPYLTTETLAPFLVATDGDLDGALAGFDQWAQQFGVTPNVAGRTAAPPTLPPGAATPSTINRGASLGDAVDAFFADMAAVNAPGAPPTV